MINLICESICTLTGAPGLASETWESINLNQPMSS